MKKLAVLGVLLFVAACASKETVTIGGLFPLTGGLSQYGEVAQNAALLAVEEINAAGGVNGAMLKIDLQDHQCTPKLALSIVEQLIAQGVKVYTSAACSGTVISIAPILEKNNAALVGTIVTAPKLTNISQAVFRNWASDINEARLFADEIKRKGYQKIGVIYEETEYAQGLKISLEQFLSESGIQIVSESFAPTATDVRSQLAKLQDQNPDLLFVSPQTVTSADMIFKELAELEYRPRLLVNDNVIKAVDLHKRYALLLDGAIGGDYIVEASAKLEKFKAQYRAKYGKDCAQLNICAGVYDAVHMLAQSMEQVDVRSALQTIDYSGASGRIQFDKAHDRVGTEYTLFVIRNGTAVPYAQT
ncbi:MAG TPA: ABC transporter substrate-binding protein [Candidatus Nanoarchaeia archaeon]|nr:ABC transporter substrate-binding protein [Candidatus Nanoarchaeia archaeon]